MRIIPTLLAILTLAATALFPAGTSAQQTDRIAFVAAMDDIPPEGRKVYVSPYLGEANAERMQGNVIIKQEDQDRLVERYGAEMSRAEHLLECERPRDPASCRMPANAVLYQFVLPRPVDEQGILTLRLVRLISDGEGKIHREAWLLGLAQRADVGWTVLGKEMVAELNGPW